MTIVFEDEHTDLAVTCPACGEFTAECRGHDEVLDERGFEVMELHAEGDHSRCIGQC